MPPVGKLGKEQENGAREQNKRNAKQTTKGTAAKQSSKPTTTAKPTKKQKQKQTKRTRTQNNRAKPTESTA